MDFNTWVFKSLNTFKKDRYSIHCYITDETERVLDKNFTLKGFNDSTLEQCLLNFFREAYANYDYVISIVTDIVNKLVIVTVTTAYGFGKYTIDKIERIQDIEEEERGILND